MIDGIKINRWIFSYAFTILFGCYFLLLLQMYTKIEFVRKAVDGIDLPVPRASQSLLFLAITMIIMLIPDGKKWGALGMPFCHHSAVCIRQPAQHKCQTCWRQPRE